MNLIELIGPNASEAFLEAISANLGPARPASHEAIEQRNAEEWADGAQQRRQEARDERDAKDAGL